MRPADPDRPLPSAPRATTDAVDCIWAATRPAAPSPALLDALWAHAAAELDRIDAARPIENPDVRLARPGSASRRRPLRRWLVTGVVVGQAAAALLITAWLGLIPHRNPPADTLVKTTPAVLHPTPALQPATAAALAPASQPMVVVGSEQTLVIRIDAAGPRVEILDQPPMFPTMAEHTPHDLFNYLENAANQ